MRKKTERIKLVIPIKLKEPVDKNHYIYYNEKYENFVPIVVEKEP
jgi:hypothetical protein